MPGITSRLHQYFAPKSEGPSIEKVSMIRTGPLLRTSLATRQLACSLLVETITSTSAAVLVDMNLRQWFPRIEWGSLLIGTRDRSAMVGS